MDIDYNMDSDMGAEASLGISESPQSGISADALNEALEVNILKKLCYVAARVLSLATYS